MEGSLSKDGGSDPKERNFRFTWPGSTGSGESRVSFLTPGKRIGPSDPKRKILGKGPAHFLFGSEGEPRSIQLPQKMVKTSTSNDTPQAGGMVGPLSDSGCISTLPGC